MSWNYRILESNHYGETYLAIHEVHYDENGEPNGYSKEPATIQGDNLEAIRWSLKKMKEAMDMPILYAGEWFPKISL